MELESGFIVDPELDGTLAGLELLHRSESGFSEIWRATKFSQFVVLKCLKEEYRENPVYEALLRKEFEIGYSLNHPAICRTWHFRKHPLLGKCIEMEWVDGLTLGERFFTAPPDEELFLKIASELCDALAYLHSRQIIHRDIKASNILITHNGDNVKLIDFGLSDSDDSAVLKMAAGTKDHIAPEILEGLTADVRTDIWGAGDVLSSLTDGHRHALRKATAPRPEKRYTHIGAFKKDLLEHRSWDWVYIVFAVVALSIAGAFLGRPSEGGAAGNAQEDAPATLDGSTTEELHEPDDSPAATKEASSGKAAGDAAPHKSTAKPGSQNAASREDVDELFRQASDLFK